MTNLVFINFPATIGSSVGTVYTAILHAVSTCCTFFSSVFDLFLLNAYSQMVTLLHRFDVIAFSANRLIAVTRSRFQGNAVRFAQVSENGLLKFSYYLDKIWNPFTCCIIFQAVTEVYNLNG